MSLIETIDKKEIYKIKFPITYWEDNTATKAIPELYSDSFVIVSPGEGSVENWDLHNIRCIDHTSNVLTFKCSKEPEEPVLVNLVILNNVKGGD